ncbi:hypothetical protein F503_06944 [Ophiostoma piceae UAMH 11346]|uniref:Ubiquitin 3 binding protein But2 C-terminal domain-containing protein n=1 Tax=Ophiostoma piceae (strain UAMH 11346) TaxID=1262450 RepID=S3CRD3_OPHP1|nr:hypothetical protein F503_06944 [Ophiostoma piceae UAMH 11346]
MKSSATVSAVLLASASIAAAMPSPLEHAPRCSKTYYPSFMQPLVEDTPDKVYEDTVSSTGVFHVSQTQDAGKTANRIYQLVGFRDIAPGSYGCQLELSFPSNYDIISSIGEDTSATPPMNVTAVLRNASEAIAYPNKYSFSSYPEALQPGKVLDGSLVAKVGTTEVIQADSCDTDLAFVFTIASSVGTSASVDFVDSLFPSIGITLTAKC